MSDQNAIPESGLSSKAADLNSELRKSASGFLLLDKPKGFSSFRALSPLKKAFPKTKIGHAGTLDPAATGLLLVGVGTATRLLEYLEAMKKTYSFTAYFGAHSESYDKESPISFTSLSRLEKESLTYERVAEALVHFQGAIQQVPPSYSAIKIQGKRAADRVRSGETVTMIAREVHLFSFLLKSFTPFLFSAETSDEENLASATFEITCSKGTYVRSLVHDLGQLLGCGAFTDNIRRLAIGGFQVSDACTLEDFSACQNPEKYLQSLGQALHHMPCVTLTPKGVDDFMLGRFLSNADFTLSPVGSTEYRALDEAGQLIAIATLNPEGFLCPKKVLAQK